MSAFRIFAVDVKRGGCEPLFLGALILGFAMLIFPFFYLLNFGDYDSADIFKTSQAMIFPFAAPLLCALPYSCMKMRENSTRFNNLMRMKMNRQGYILPRFFANGVIGAAVLMIPQILLLIVVLIYNPGINSTEIIRVILLAAPFGFAYSSFSYGLSFFNVKSYIPATAPQILYMLMVYAFPILGLTRFYPPLGISPWIYGSVYYSDLLLISFAMTAAAAVMAFIGFLIERRREL